MAENYFILLGLNPYDDWDEETFRRTLKEKQAEWNRKRTGFGKEALPAQKYIELIPEIKRVMNDPALRVREAQEAKKVSGKSQGFAREQVERQEARLIEFEQRLRTLQRKGYLDDGEFRVLVSDFKDVLTEDEIIKQVEVQILSSLDVQPTLEELPLDAAILADVDEKLAQLDMSSLYELLRLPQMATRSELYRSAESVFDELMRHQPKTVEVTAGTSLAGYAKNIFSSEKKRQRYDEHVAERAKQKRMAPSDQAKYHNAAQTEPVTPRKQESDLSELRVRNIGNALRLTWKWPDNCYEALVFYSNREWPRPQQNLGTRLRVTKAEYESGGHYDLNAPPNQRYYIVVVALVHTQGGLILTPGSRIEGFLWPLVTITYEVKNPRLGRNQRTLHLYTLQPCHVPTLVLISKLRRQPFNRAEGEEIHREVGPLEIPMERVIRLPDTPFPPETYARLFLEDDRNYDFLTIHHPHERKLRLDR